MEGARGVLRRPLGWGGVLLAGALGSIMTFSYLGGFLDPIHHLHGLKVGIVNEDSPVDVAGNHIDGGTQVVDKLQAGDHREVTFVVYRTRAAAVDAIHDDRIIGAIDVRPDFSAAIGQVGTSGGLGHRARIDMITNDGAGLFQAQVFARVTSEVDVEVNKEVNRQLVAVLTDVDVKIEPAGAAIVGRPVTIRTVDEISVLGKTGRGLGPFYAAVMATLTGFLATSIASLMVDVLRGTEHLELLGKEVPIEAFAERPLATWVAKAVLAVSGACLGALALAITAVEVLGLPTAFWPTFGLAALGASAIALVTLIFLTLFGIGGELLGVLFTTIFGVPSALGVYPAEALPPFFRFVSSWHPMHYLTDGMRALTFYDGRADAGLRGAVVVLALWLVGAGVVGYLSALLIDRRGGSVGTKLRDRSFRTIIVGRPGRPPHHLLPHHARPAETPAADGSAEALP